MKDRDVCKALAPNSTAAVPWLCRRRIVPIEKRCTQLRENLGGAMGGAGRRSAGIADAGAACPLQSVTDGLACVLGVAAHCVCAVVDFAAAVVLARRLALSKFDPH